MIDSTNNLGKWGQGGLLVTLGLLVGCQGLSEAIGGARPPTPTVPTDVRSEMRDARFFLAYPDETIGPDSGLQAPGAVVPPGHTQYD